MKTAKKKRLTAPAIGVRLLTLPETTRRRGRKRISESRATEIRTRLAEWKQTPEPAAAAVYTPNILWRQERVYTTYQKASS
jgi:hypothetical protein